MLDIISALAEYEGRAEDADRLQAPPCDALCVERPADRQFNRNLAVFFAGALEQPTVTHQIAYLHDAANAQEDQLARYARRLAVGAEEWTVTPAVWARMIETLRAWATAIHEHAVGKSAA